MESDPFPLTADGRNVADRLTLTFYDQVNKEIADLQERFKGGLTFSELQESVQAFLLVAIEGAAWLIRSGPDKKKAVLGGLSMMIDRLAIERILPPWLRWLGPVVRPVIKSLLLQWADRQIEAIYRHLFPSDDA